MRLPLRSGLVSLILATALGCTSVPEKAPVQTGPIDISGSDWRVTDHVILVTDASGTMWMEETFPDAKALTRSFVSAMPAGDVRSARPGTYSAGLVGFGGDERINAPLASFDRSRLASTASQLKILGDINGMGGTTPYAAVLTESAKQLAGKRGRAALVFFSDGVPDHEAAALVAGQRLVKSYPDELCIYAVHTGDDEEGFNFLKRLTTLTRCGGVRTAASLGTGAEVQQFARVVFVAPGQLPPVAAASPCAGVVRLRGIEFEFDRAAIKADSRPVLDVAAEQLRGCPDIHVTISGHTDSVGAESYNMDLSNKRAQATRDYLVQEGVSAGRLESEGLGESEPIAPNDSASGRAQNRRVELAPIR